MCRTLSKTYFLLIWSFSAAFIAAPFLGCDSRETGVIEATPDAYTDPNLNPALGPNAGINE
jgi:hypothetical protein